MKVQDEKDRYREIEFRGKASDSEWAYGYLIVMPDGSCGIFQFGNFEEGAVDVVPKTVGEFTGLKDKNKKAIYEGDIIQYSDTDKGIIQGKILSQQGCFMLKISPETVKPYPLFILDIAQFEVIGNIHDNPELINE